MPQSASLCDRHRGGRRRPQAASKAKLSALKRPRGRPRRAPSQKRHPVKVYFASEELARISDKATQAGLPLSEFLRCAGLEVELAEVPPINREAFSHLARIGGNLNQLAHHLNTGVQIPFGGPIPDLNLLAGLLLAVRRGLLPDQARKRRRNDPQDPS
jgi:hypothetical protein